MRKRFEHFIFSPFSSMFRFCLHAEHRTVIALNHPSGKLSIDCEYSVSLKATENILKYCFKHWRLIDSPGRLPASFSNTSMLSISLAGYKSWIPLTSSSCSWRISWKAQSWFSERNEPWHSRKNLPLHWMAVHLIPSSQVRRYKPRPPPQFFRHCQWFWRIPRSDP